MHSHTGAPASLNSLPSADPDRGSTNVVIDTPLHSRCKYKYDENAALFRLGKLMPAGMHFPHNFGYVPSTRGEDGDPLDVLVLGDEPLLVGCVVPVYLIGVIEAEQRESGKQRAVRNDRLLGVISTPYNAPELCSLEDMHPWRLDEIEQFFIAYNTAQGREFTPLGRHGAERAGQLLALGTAEYQRNHQR